MIQKAEYLQLVAESGLCAAKCKPDMYEYLLVEACHFLLDVLREGVPYPPDDLLLAQCADYDLRDPHQLVIAMERLPRFIN